MRPETTITGRPKSKGRHGVDAVLFAVIAVLFAWRVVPALGTGVLDMRRDWIVSQAQEPVLFWALVLGHAAVIGFSAWWAARSARAVLRSAGQEGA